MASSTRALLDIPGLEVVGRGVYLRPYQPYELKEILFQRGNDRTYYAQEIGQDYALPEGYEVNASPPSSQPLNRVMIEESWERFEKQMSLDANLAVSSVPFSVDVHANQTRQLRSEDEAYYALRTSFCPLWVVYVPNTTQFPEHIFDLDVPTPFRHEHRKTYEKFFERFGTHYIKRVWVGGKATLAFTISKSASISKEEIQVGLKASGFGLVSGAGNSDMQKSKEKLQSNSSCTVFGNGGDALRLAALSSLDETAYNAWLATVKDNPEVIEFEAVGIWTLIHDEEKAQALMEAYQTATIFKPITAVFSIDRYVHFLRGDKYFTYDLDTGHSAKPRPISADFPKLAEAGFEWIDAAFRGDHFHSGDHEDLRRKLFCFRRDKYIRVDLDTNTIDAGYPKSIAEGWPGVTFDRLDAALSGSYDTVYFFRGNQYIRFNMLTHRVEEGYPELLSKRWVGVTFDRIDAALYWGNGKVYFFRGDQHIRYDMVMRRVDPGYPKFITGGYVEDWRFFD